MGYSPEAELQLVSGRLIEVHKRSTCQSCMQHSAIAPYALSPDTYKTSNQLMMIKYSVPGHFLVPNPMLSNCSDSNIAAYVHSVVHSPIALPPIRVNAGERNGTRLARVSFATLWRVRLLLTHSAFATRINPELQRTKHMSASIRKCSEQRTKRTKHSCQNTSTSSLKKQ